ncbi:tyrosine-type recombinase/integrase [Myxococcaceae bacterium JPH2]|nr:tyrosine-type recombinase/integrase [Myxococcaceae bacterium JPH2]
MRWRRADGSVAKEVIPAATRAEARRKAHQLEEAAWMERQGLADARPVELTVSEAIALRLAALPVEFASAKNLREKLAYVEAALGARKLGSVAADDVLMMLAKLTHLAPQTREHIRMTGQGLFTFMRTKTKKYKGDNPFKDAGPVSVPKRQVRVYPRDMLPRLFETLAPEYRAPAATALMTGVRKGEVRAMRKEWVNLRERYILIAGGGHRQTTKGGRERRVPIPELLVPFIEAQMETPGPYLFPKPGDSEPHSAHWRVHDIMARALVRIGMIKAWRPYCLRRSCKWKDAPAFEVGQATCPNCGRKARWKALPVDLRFKHLRSTWGTTAYSVTKDLRLVADVLGHADMETTREHYAVALPEHVVAGAEATAAMLAPWAPRGKNREEIQPKVSTRPHGAAAEIVNPIEDLGKLSKRKERCPMAYDGFLNRRPQVRFLSGPLRNSLIFLAFLLQRRLALERASQVSGATWAILPPVDALSSGRSRIDRRTRP